MGEWADYWAPEERGTIVGSVGWTEDATAVALLAHRHGMAKYDAVYRLVHSMRRELLEDIQRNLVFLSHAVADELRERATGQRDEPGDHFGDRELHPG